MSLCFSCYHTPVVVSSNNKIKCASCSKITIMSDLLCYRCAINANRCQACGRFTKEKQKEKEISITNENNYLEWDNDFLSPTDNIFVLVKPCTIDQLIAVYERGDNQTWWQNFKKTMWSEVFQRYSLFYYGVKKWLN